MTQRPMIEFYVQSHSAEDDVMDSTAAHTSVILNRVFDMLERDYGVTITADRIEGLSTVVLQKWYNEMIKVRKWKPATANNYVVLVRPFLRWAAIMKDKGVPYIDEDVSIALKTKKLPNPDKLPEDQRPKNKYYTIDQVQDLLHGVRGHNIIRDRAIIAMLMWSALRVGELCQVTVGEYKSSKEKQGDFFQTVRVMRKGGAVKDVEIGSGAYAYVDEYLKSRADAADAEPLFMTDRGKPCSPKQIYKCLSYKQKKVGVATGPHALRHTSLSTLEKDGSPSIVRDIANHKSWHITNRYVHTSHSERLAALNNLPWQ